MNQLIVDFEIEILILSLKNETSLVKDLCSMLKNVGKIHNKKDKNTLIMKGAFESCLKLQDKRGNSKGSFKIDNIDAVSTGGAGSKALVNLSANVCTI